MAQSLLRYVQQQHSDSPVRTQRYLEVWKRFMDQYKEIQNLEKDYQILLVNPSVLERQRRAHELLEQASDYEREGAMNRSSRYYLDALEHYNDLVLEAYKTVAFQYLILAKKKIERTPSRHRLFGRMVRLKNEAQEACRVAKNLHDHNQSKMQYLLAIKNGFEIFHL